MAASTFDLTTPVGPLHAQAVTVLWVLALVLWLLVLPLEVVLFS